MIRKISHQHLGRSNRGWLRSLFHFSFAEYYNPDNMNFGVLRVLNDDLVASKTGFDTHPHRDMEIISYVVHGELTHGDSMGNKSTISRGQVQYMSAGTGVAHSEHNLGDEELRFLQIWILPDQKRHTPAYGDLKMNWDLRKGKWLQFVSPEGGGAPIEIHQDANFYAVELAVGQRIEFEVKPGRQAYLALIEGSALINGLRLETRDALESVEESLSIHADQPDQTAHLLVIEMAKG